MTKIVNWCFELSQPLGIIHIRGEGLYILGVKETFINIKRYIVERTNKAER